MSSTFNSPTHVYLLLCNNKDHVNSKSNSGVNRMAKEVSLFLKYPGPALVLQRLQHSFLECVVEYKVGTEVELQTLTPSQLHSEYQLKGSAALIDDEIVVQFVPKHAGIHSARIFADTRELCRPVAFRVTRNCEVENLPMDKPVQRPAPPPQMPIARQSFYARDQLPSPERSLSPSEQGESQLAQSYQQGEWVRGYTSDPALSSHLQGHPQRASYYSSASGGSRPQSMIRDEAFAGDLMSSKPDQSSFSQLYVTKKAGLPGYGTRKGMPTLDHRSVVTSDTLQMLRKDIDIQLASHLSRAKIKKRCSICSKKMRSSRSVPVGEEDYCEPCFRRQYLLRSAIEHFMVPSIQECTVEVPVNKKGTKFVSARKTIPNVNLRGLEPVDVRRAQAEFSKFDMESNGWINKAVMLPVMKACFSSSLNDREIKTLLQSHSLKAMIDSFGLEQREDVHEIEFLALLAFVARERQRLRANTDPHSKFTRSDLEMAYAFRKQFVSTKQGPPSNPLYSKPTIGETDYPDYTRMKQRASQYFPRSPTHPVVEAMSRHSQYDPQASLGVTSPHQPNPLLSGPTHGESALSPPAFRQSSRLPSQEFSSPLRHSRLPPVGLSSSRNTSGFVDLEGDVRLGESQVGTVDLPEEDQEENELPALPPGKPDPTAPQLTNPLLNKRPANTKRMMEELRLTGGSADGWMLY